MRMRYCARALAAALTTAAITAPVSQAQIDNYEPPMTPAPSTSAQGTGGSTDWAVIGLSAAGGVALIGGAVAVPRRLHRRTTVAGRN